MSYSLGEILASYENIVDAVVDGKMTEDDGFKEILHDLEDLLTEKVDAWIAKLQTIETYRKHCEDRAKEWSKREKATENMLTRMKDYLTASMEASSFPVLRGEEGTLKLVKNSQPRLILNLQTKKISLSHAITNVDHDLLHNYSEFFRQTSYFCVDTEALKNAITSGRKIDFANIEFGHHVRIL